MIRELLFPFVLLLAPSLYSQNPLFVSDYHWDAKADYSINMGNEEPMMALKEKFVVEFAYSEDGTLEEYYLEHKALLLNSNDRIDAYNKIYLPYSNTSELIRSKARVTNKDGKTIVLDDSKMLSAQDGETGKFYKYFAFEGVEKGSIIEYYYVEKKQPSYSGIAMLLQGEYDKTNIDFDLYAPKNLRFAFKSYNGLPEVAKDTVSKDFSHWSLGMETLEGLQRESQAPYDASRGYLVYKLDKNLAKNLNDISSYGPVAQNIYGYLYSEPTKKAVSMIDKLVSQTIDRETSDIEAKIRSLDNSIKMEFYLTEVESEALTDLEEILSKKVANSNGMMKLYTAILNHLGIEHEIVITTNRESMKFDREFEAHNFLSEYLIYFPGPGTYLSPTKTDSRYGYPPAWLTDNHGLFIKEVSVGNFKSAVGRIKYVEPLGADRSVDKMVIDVQFDVDDPTSNTIQLDRSFTGYYALPIQPYIHLVKGKDMEDLVQGLAKSMNENVQVDKFEILNGKPELFGLQPIHFIIDLKTDSFVERAGNKYLFKVGELIGTQIQMYQEKERKLPLENEFKRSYLRTINLKLPKGYKMKNLNELDSDKRYVENGEELFYFKSSHHIEDGILTIRADEQYNINIVPPSLFEEYRKVINSAADFNKIILVFEPMQE